MPKNEAAALLREARIIYRELAEWQDTESVFPQNDCMSQLLQLLPNGGNRFVAFAIHKQECRHLDESSDTVAIPIQHRSDGVLEFRVQWPDGAPDDLRHRYALSVGVKIGSRCFLSSSWRLNTWLCKHALAQSVLRDGWMPIAQLSLQRSILRYSTIWQLSVVVASREHLPIGPVEVLAVEAMFGAEECSILREQSCATLLETVLWQFTALELLNGAPLTARGAFNLEAYCFLEFDAAPDVWYFPLLESLEILTADGGLSISQADLIATAIDGFWIVPLGNGSGDEAAAAEWARDALGTEPSDLSPKRRVEVTLHLEGGADSTGRLYLLEALETLCLT